MKLYFKRAAPFFILNIKCISKNTNKNKMGINAGYRAKLATISPFKSKIKLRCIPQPGHSKCVTALNIQGSWCASSQPAIFKRYNILIAEGEF